MIRSEGFEDHEKQPNHLQFHEWLVNILNDANSIDLYGCWDGDFFEPCEGHTEVDVSKIQEETFYFRERFRYSVTNAQVQK